MKLVISLVALLAMATSFSQSLENEAKIIEFLGQERYNQILESNPNYLKFLDVRCSFGFKIIDYVDEKMGNMTVIDYVAYRVDQGNGKDTTGLCKKGVGKDFDTPEEFLNHYNEGTLNILKYYIQYDRFEINYYVLGTTGKVLVVYPVDYINKLIAENK